MESFCVTRTSAARYTCLVSVSEGCNGEKETKYRPERLCDRSDEERDHGLVFQCKDDSMLKSLGQNGYQGKMYDDQREVEEQRQETQALC
jgi:hypothetical protein